MNDCTDCVYHYYDTEEEQFCEHEKFLEEDFFDKQGNCKYWTEKETQAH